MTATHRLRNRIVLMFCLFAAFISGIFSLFSFMFIYNIEDLSLIKTLEGEAAYIAGHLHRHQTLPSPRYPYIAIYKSPDRFPADLGRAYAANPQRREFFGDNGRHYHLHIAKDAEVYLVAEVSGQLVVRPIRGQLIAILAAVALSMFAIALLIGYRMAGKATAPLSELVALIKSSAPQELPRDFARQFPDNEVGALARSLEGAMLQIDEYIRREQHFTRDTSHELRTPIAVIKGAAELLSTRQHPPETQALVQRIAAAAQQMAAIVEVLLALATGAQHQSALDEIRLLPLIERAVVDHAHLIGEKNVTVQVEVPADASVHGSQSVIAILLNNLISNAFQYTARGRVTITFDQNQLHIADTGAGIDVRLIPDMFSTLVKGEGSRGFGIGLSVVKRLCERHGIALHVDSDPSGTQVTLNFAAPSCSKNP
ncbi:HAMP domain-containing histidine kinase [Exilibacterium tricleocarpae]|uniref:histidine kinase n=1 Tax=Exilibacterium tricleocarpae TaxID=2591008 RepID=A0A545TYW1_9GAMM|nr:HAMP domain-containing sensor histidine kinase [Exilibacterium tricleocarpae]TQV82405.1 HAMP domain-containing histidine kinase [Exilibacterium tricleocarpae]